MKVAVLMSTYNGEKYIREQIDSILSQNGNFEIDLVVRDDGSKDRTQDILNEYQSLSKLRWYSGKNMGPGKSFIDLLYKTRGYDYYAFSDQDDVWLPNKIKRAVEMLQQYESEAVYFCNVEYVDHKLCSLGGNTYKKTVPTDSYSAILNPCYLGCTMVFNVQLASVIQEHMLPRNLYIHDAFVARVCAAVGGNIEFDNRVYVKYRQHGNNVIGSTVGKVDAIKRRVKMIMGNDKVGIVDELVELRKIYSDKIGSKEKKWIDEIINYKKGCFSKYILAFSNKPSFTSVNMRVTIGLKILLENL